MTIMNKKNHVEIGKIQLFKKQTKAVNQIKKSHIIHAAAEMQSLLFSCLFTKQKQIKKFVYKSAVEHTLKQT
jgi:hypothetical protein